MIPDEIRKLLGGYATGTLTDEERNLLFSAALEDQELFDALAAEEVLRELLAEPATRQALIEELRQQPVLDASPLRDQRVPLEFAARAASPPPRPARAELQSLAEPFWSPRRLAVAGGFAMVVLIAGGVQYKRLHAPGEAPVNLAMNRAPERSPSAAAEQEAARSTAPSATRPTLGSSKETVRQLADTRVAAVRRAEERQAEANGVEPGRVNLRNDENRAAVPSAVPRDAAESEKKVEKETVNADPARERLNQALREQAAQAPPAETASVESAIPPAAAVPAPPSNSGQTRAAGQTETKVNSRERAGAGRSTLITPSQIVTGGLRKAASPPLPPPPAPKAVAPTNQFREMDAKVTDVNGTIVSINVGSNVGLRAGDSIEIVRENRVIATSKLSQVGATFAVGSVQRTAGSADTPQAGDAVRRAATSQPQR